MQPLAIRDWKQTINCSMSTEYLYYNNQIVMQWRHSVRLCVIQKVQFLEISLWRSLEELHLPGLIEISIINRLIRYTITQVCCSHCQNKNKPINNFTLQLLNYAKVTILNRQLQTIQEQVPDLQIPSYLTLTNQLHHRKVLRVKQLVRWTRGILYLIDWWEIKISNYVTKATIG